MAQKEGRLPAALRQRRARPPQDDASDDEDEVVVDEGSENEGDGAGADSGKDSGSDVDDNSEDEGKRVDRARMAQAVRGKKEKGINWLPIIFLMLFIGPGILGAVDFLLNLPMFAHLRSPPDTRECLVKYYKRVNPGRMEEVDIDGVLAKYKGREKVLFANLEKKYRVKVPPECMPK